MGKDAKGNFIGLDPERGLITEAGSRGGKGAALLIQNSRRWAHNLLVIDPKGENYRQSWEAREAMGHAVHLVDPFHFVKGPERHRARFNPIVDVDQNSPTAREALEKIADGIVVRADPHHAQWDDGAAAILAGAMAWVKVTAPPELQTLTTVRQFLLQDDDTLGDDADQMAEIDAYGGILKSTAVTIRKAIKTADSMENEFFQGARRQSSWIDSDPIKNTLSSSTFKMSELKEGYASVFLVIPPEYLATRAGFLRLFVQTALNAMMKKENGKRCLFILDEFFSLGAMTEISKAMGGAASFGTHIWPFLQDHGQLSQLYGDRGAGTFFANSDAHIFFANDQDPEALNYLSDRLGRIGPDELEGPPKPAAFDPTKHANAWFTPEEQVLRRAKAENLHRAKEEKLVRGHAHQMQALGQPRLTPQEVAQLTGKGTTDQLARSMIAFIKGGDVLNLQLVPYFQGHQPETPQPKKQQTDELLPDPEAATGFVLDKETRTSLMGGAFVICFSVIVVTLCAIFWRDTLIPDWRTFWQLLLGSGLTLLAYASYVVWQNREGLRRGFQSMQNR